MSAPGNTCMLKVYMYKCVCVCLCVYVCVCVCVSPMKQLLL